MRVDPQVTTLLDYHHAPHRRAENGRPGEGEERNGAAGADLVLAVPEGTVARSSDGSVVADLVTTGTSSDALAIMDPARFTTGVSQ